MNLPTWKSLIVASALFAMSTTIACSDDDSKTDYTQEQACSFSTNDDGKLVPEYPDADCDGDLMSNGFELANGFDPKDPDENNNGQLDGWDDEDDDGLPNYLEERLELDPRNPTTPVDDAEQSALPDGLKDSDGDGTVNMVEAWMAEPNLDADTKEGEAFLTPTLDPQDPNVKAGACDPLDPDAKPIFKDMAFRFTKLDITAPSSLGNILSNFMIPDIEEFVINIMAPVTDFEHAHCVSYFNLFAASGVDTEDGDGEKTFELEDISGIEGAKETAPVRAVVIQTSENSAFFRTTVPLSMIFPGMEPGKEPRDRFLLPLEHITAVGNLTMEEDGSVTLEAALSGAIPVEDAKALNVIGLNLYKLLKGQPLISVPSADESAGFTKEGGFLLRATFNAHTVPFNFEN